ncbi:MAG: serine/threonine protein kinase, partial [Planctomycetes bacterium]|nr:serine/threonine protein kinase [Planctomycetota bacterium]
GGMGSVYLGHHEGLNKSVAVKILAPELMKEGTFRERFLREARTAAKLEHANVVQVFDVGESPNHAFIVMQFVEGRSLDAILKERGKLSPKEVIGIVRRVAVALGAAHKAGIVHRDVKPANILVSKDGHVKVADFGLARDVAGGEKSLSQTGEIVGTPNYMAPEQATGGKVDGRTDLYSLGATMYHLLTGKVPFTGTSALSIVVKHLNEPVPPPESLEPSIPKPISDVILRLMAKSPDERYQSAEDLVKALEAIGAGTVRTAGPVAPPPKTRVWPVVAAAVVAVAALGVGGYFLFRPKPQGQAAPEKPQPQAEQKPDTQPDVPAKPDPHDELLKALCMQKDEKEQKAIIELDRSLHAVLRAIEQGSVDGARKYYAFFPDFLTGEDTKSFRIARFLKGGKAVEVRSIYFPKAIVAGAAMKLRTGAGTEEEIFWLRPKETWLLPSPMADIGHDLLVRRLQEKQQGEEQRRWVKELDLRFDGMRDAIRAREYDKAAEYVFTSGPRMERSPKEMVIALADKILRRDPDYELKGVEPHLMEFHPSAKGPEATMHLMLQLCRTGSGEIVERAAESPMTWVLDRGQWKWRWGHKRDR